MSSPKFGDVRNNPITHIREIYDGEAWVPDTSDVTIKIKQKNLPTSGPKERPKQNHGDGSKEGVPVAPPVQPPETGKSRYLKYLLLLLVLVVVGVATLSLLPAYSSPEQSALPGTADNPFVIRTTEDFLRIPGTGVSGYYVLEEDLDFSGYSNLENTLLSTFSGVLDGQGHTITGLKMTANSGYCGLFEKNSGTIRNLNIVGAEVTTDNSVSTLGILAAENTGIIENCHITGTVDVSSLYTGGIVGLNRGSILSSSFTGIVSSVGAYGVDIYGTTNYGFGYSTGGIAGVVYGYNSVIEGCFVSGDIRGVGDVGGIGGTVVYMCRVADSTSAGSVYASHGSEYGGTIAKAGGIAGVVRDIDAVIDSCTSHASVSVEKINNPMFITCDGEIVASIEEGAKVI